MGVAHRVESVLGSIEQQTLDSPARFPARSSGSTGPSRNRRPSWRCSSRRSRRSWGLRGRDLQEPLADRQRSRAPFEGPQPDREPAIDGAVGAAGGDERLRRAVRADPAGFLPRADDRRPRRDLADRVAPESARSVTSTVRRSRNGDSRNGDESVILVAHEILPSQAMSLGDLPIAGIVTELGGATSHAAILARSRGIPAVSGVDGIMSEVRKRRPDDRRRPRRHGDRPARPGGDLGLSQGPARVLQPQGPAGRQPRPARARAPTAPTSSCWPTSTTSPTPRPPTRSARPASACSGPSISS